MIHEWDMSDTKLLASLSGSKNAGKFGLDLGVTVCSTDTLVQAREYIGTGTREVQFLSSKLFDITSL